MCNKLTAAQQNEITALIPLADGYARRFSRTDDEFVSVAYLALCEAVARYDPNRGASVKTYASGVIWRRLMQHVRKLQRLPRLYSYLQTVPAEDAPLIDSLDSLSPGQRQAAQEILDRNEGEGGIIPEEKSRGGTRKRRDAALKRALRLQQKEVK